LQKKTITGGKRTRGLLPGGHRRGEDRNPRGTTPPLRRKGLLLEREGRRLLPLRNRFEFQKKTTAKVSYSMEKGKEFKSSTGKRR